MSVNVVEQSTPGSAAGDEQSILGSAAGSCECNCSRCFADF